MTYLVVTATLGEPKAMKVEIVVLSLALTLGACGAVLVDDDWDDGDRTDTNLPEESAWYANNTAGIPTLTAAPGALAGLVRVFETNTTSRLWITHFTEEGTPAELSLGDTIKATLVFVPSGVTINPATSRGLRIGLFNFSEAGATRVSADGFSTGSGGGAPGANVTGYMLNLNFAQAFTINSPIEILKRTDLPTNNLMAASAVFTRIGTTGGGLAQTPGFSNDVPYTLEFSVRSFVDSVDITVTISDTNGWSISHTVNDASAPVTRFDSLALRPNSVADTADTFTFKQFKAEVIPFVSRITGVVLNSEPFFSLTVNFESLPGKTYQLETAETVDATEWDIIGTTTATGGSASIDDPNGYFDDQRFYRVQQLP